MSVKHSHKVHRYERIDGQWCCNIRGCTHFLPNNVRKGVVGRPSLCNTCDEEFIVDTVNLLQNKPMCPTCDVDNPTRILAAQIEEQESKV